ncbi:TPA: ankyrin repeat domain-containing protein [Legionella pneumophila]|nr:ankyrin repeat domain-containing protein [Legionella pneumophila]HAT9117183.1 ankyrin repeat domain-containing protein [Legionella pneumophila subsp. pneumophila]HAT1847705.1 ankyrin repeat domain-containing protein [Legionella pneumophila]HAT1872644.1 ankyrin repeat domain-containing protein [Legionella pneumophila]HAT2074310.1 ankyrin repeat domain-containing protein [Legionella pneumophila]HAT8324070.1 ankyrin repeat domain-containing protein [Legionella pneumophila]
MSFSKISKKLKNNTVLIEEIANQDTYDLSHNSEPENQLSISEESSSPLLENSGENLVQQACIDGNLRKLKELLICDMWGIDEISLNQVNNRGETLLMLAIKYGHKEIAVFLARSIFHLHKIDNSGKSALSLAHEKRWDDIVQLILESINNREDRMRELHYAAIHGYVESVSQLLGVIDKYGFTTPRFILDGDDIPRFENIFHAACCGGKLEIVQLLLEHGADINSRNQFSDNKYDYYTATPILVACRYGHANIVEYLLAQHEIEYDINELLHTAVGFGHFAVLDLLLRHSKEKNIALNLNIVGEYPLTHFSATLLTRACYLGQVDIVDRLLAEDIDMSNADNRQALWTAIFCAKTQGSPAIDIIDRLLAENDRQNIDIPLDGFNELALWAYRQPFVGILDRLIIRGVDFHRERDPGDYPLIEAVKNGYKDIVHRLIDLSVDVNLRDRKGRTALFCAVMQGEKEIVELLINNGADPNIQDNEGVTPLMKVVPTDDHEIVELLLNAGADTSIKDNRNRLAMDLAKHRPYHMKLLKDATEIQNANKSSSSSNQSANMLYTLWSSNRGDLREEAKYMEKNTPHPF